MSNQDEDEVEDELEALEKEVNSSPSRLLVISNHQTVRSPGPSPAHNSNKTNSLPCQQPTPPSLLSISSTREPKLAGLEHGKEPRQPPSPCSHNPNP